MKGRRFEYPLWWRLSAAAQAKLMQYQWDNYGEILDIPKPTQTSKGVWMSVQLENLEEISRIMRQAPSRSRGEAK